MKFTRKTVNPLPINDTVFAVARLAEKDRLTHPEETINATIGSLCDEDGKLVAYQSVFSHYDQIDDRLKASYAKSFLGNPDFCEQVYHWVLASNCSKLAHRVIATPGGTGAVASCLHSFLDQNETVILPNIAWGSYQLMADMYQLNTVTYEMFENDHFHLNSIRSAVEKVLKTQDKVVIVINDPCHNPTGYSLTQDEWTKLIEFFNEVSKKHPVIIINDIAYIDYSYNLAHSRDYLNVFDHISSNILVSICFSCSKTMTSYGLRCGASILLAQKEEDVQQATIVLEKFARATWSNIPNAAMVNFVNMVTNYQDEFIAEKNKYIELLHQRSSIFLNEAKDCGLPCYPYKEGFFITLKIEDSKVKERYHEELIKNHIYTVQVKNGIRVAICSLPISKVQGLAYKMQNILIQLS